MELVRPTEVDNLGIWDMRGEFLDNGDMVLYGSGGLGRYDSYAEWFEKISQDKHGLLPGRVPQDVYCSAEEGRAIGMICVRHYITPELELTSGHIGYCVRPSMRRMGYGKKQLALALEKARELGLNEVMVTCDVKNPASASVAMSFNAREIEPVPNDVGSQTRRFWIKTSS